jgi:hypothetical protein
LEKILGEKVGKRKEESPIRFIPEVGGDLLYRTLTDKKLRIKDDVAW